MSVPRVGLLLLTRAPKSVVVEPLSGYLFEYWKVELFKLVDFPVYRELESVSGLAADAILKHCAVLAQQSVEGTSPLSLSGTFSHGDGNSC